MPVNFIYPEYEVVRNTSKCIQCLACVRQCANEVHSFDKENKVLKAAEENCVNCHRCVSLCPTRALKITKTDNTFRENHNWTNSDISDVYRQASTGGVLLSSMGNPKPYPVYWDKMLINASQDVYKRQALISVNGNARRRQYINITINCAHGDTKTVSQFSCGYGLAV